jgi:conjugative transfer signal peptidase TraF
VVNELFMQLIGRKPFSKPVRTLIVALDIVCFLYVIIYAGFSVLFQGYLGVTLNPTPSIPRGLYRFVHQPIQRGIVIAFPQPHKSGVIMFKLPLGGKYLLKYVAALPGDSVDVSNQGVWINNRFWPNSQPDSPIAHPFLGHHTIGPGYVWAMGTNIYSFDSRYFGEVLESNVAYTLRPSPLFGISDKDLCAANETSKSPNPCYLPAHSPFSK